MKKLTNKQRCRNCIHKCVCPYIDHYANLEGFGRCNHYYSKERAYKKREGEK